MLDPQFDFLGVQGNRLSGRIERPRTRCNRYAVLRAGRCHGGTVGRAQTANVAADSARRMDEPEGIAQAVRFLASGESRYMPGAGIVVDGGLAQL